MAKRTNKTTTPEEPETEVSASTDAAVEMDLEIGDDAEFFTPPSDLRAKAPELRGRGGVATDPVAAAEAALKRMASSFDNWMADETLRLVETWNEAEASGFEGEAREAFHRAAHDIKGQAATLGFPLAGLVAASLCKLLETIEGGKLPQDLVRQHVQSVRAMFVEQAREEGSPTAVKLARRLDEVTRDFLDQCAKAA